MRRTYTLLSSATLIASLFVTTSALARWIEVTPSLSSSSNDIMRVISSDRYSTRVEFRLPGIERDSVNIDGSEYYRATIPGAGVTTIVGEPELPRVGGNIMIPANATPTMTIVSQDNVEWKMGAPVPSKGSLTRNVDPASVPYKFSANYSTGSFPANTISLGKPFRLRDATGVNLLFHPLRYDAASGKTTITRRLVVDITTSTPAGKSGKPVAIMSHNGKIDPSFLNVYKRAFSNFGAMVSLNSREVSTEHFVRALGGILVITPERFRDTIAPLVEWRKQTGYAVEVTTVPAGVKPADVKALIQRAYDINKIAYVILVGDADSVPPFPGVSGNASYNEADPLYGTVAGNDKWPDVIIGRLTAETNDELATQVNRTLRYEREPGSGEWYSKAVGMASDEGDPSDGARMDKVRDTLLGWHYTQVDQFYDPGASADSVSAAVNEGRGFMNYIGHGDVTLWVTTGFNNTNVNALTNDGKWPVIVSVACVNGDFDGQTSFAEAWLRAGTPANPRGAIAMFASSTNQAWIEPTIGQLEIAQMLTTRKATTVGSLFLNGSVAVLESGMDRAEQTFETWHIFGDPTVTMRTQQPGAIRASSTVWAPGAPSYILNVGEPDIRGGITQNGELIATGVSTSDGNLEMRVLRVPMIGAATLTLTGPDKIPAIVDINFEKSEKPLLVSGTFTVNNRVDGTAFLGERLSIGGSFTNLGASAASGATVRVSSVIGPATLVSDSVTLADVPSEGVIALPMGGLELAVANDAQANDAIVVRLEWDVPNGHSGAQSITLRVQRAALAITSLGLGEFTEGTYLGIAPGTTGPMTLVVTNTGNETITDGELVHAMPTACLSAIDGSMRLPALAPGQSATLNQLTATIASNCVPRQTGEIRLAGSYTSVAMHPSLAVQSTFTVGKIRVFSANYENVNLPLEDGAPASTDFGVVMEDTGLIMDIQVKVDITHTYIGDLVVGLVHPDGTYVNFHANGGGSADNLNLLLGKGGTPFANLSKFVGKEAKGTWLLRMRDTTKPDPGVLNNVKITVWSY